MKSIGDSIGRYVKSDPANFNGLWKEYVRIRIAMNIEKPLKRRMKLKKDANKWNWINFKYERVSSFCFVCGIIGHSESECNVVYANPEKTVERAYGAWLRAPNRNSKVGPGAQWLRNVHDDEPRWMTKGSMGPGSSTTEYGGKMEEERFMDVDGVLREISGDQESVRVITRDKRDSNEQNLGHDQGGDIDGRNLNLNEKIVIDQKRKRVEQGMKGGNIGHDNIEIVGPTNLTGPKNLDMAGSGIQTRPPL